MSGNKDILPRLGAQTYNLWRTPLCMTAKLQVISTLGYAAAELAGFNGTDYEGVDAPTLKAEAQKLGLEICGAHVPYKVFGESMNNIIAYHKALGVHWVAIPRPVVECRADIDALIDNMKSYAKALRAEGLDLYYHCHDFEFREFDGVTAMERILSDTDVMLEIDVFWAAKGGVDVMDFLDRHADRILYLHLKDANDDGPCAVGFGRMDCRGFLDKAAAMGLSHVIVEDDRQQPDGITSICNSMQTLRTYGVVG